MRSVLYLSSLLAVIANIGSAASVKLLNAELGDAAAYFSQLTGNSYIVDFKTEEKISISREISDKTDEIHNVFLEIVQDLGAQMLENGEGRFLISRQKTPTEHNSDVEVKRLMLAGRVSLDGVKNLIGKIKTLNEIQIIEYSTNDDSILLAASQKQLSELFAIINNLPSRNVKTPENKPQVIDEGKIADQSRELNTLKVTKVVDLNFADADELVTNVQPIFSQNGIDGTVSIAAHRSANQLIISAQKDQIENIISVISRLDRKPRQVYVDAIIAEISEDTASKLGLQFSVNSGNVSASLVSGLSGINIGAAAGDPFLAGAAGGLISAGNGANVIPDIGIMLSALQGDKDTRILATPSLMTTENRESTILVGQNVPFITGQFTTGEGNSVNPFQTIKREDLGTSLKLKPRIGPNGNILIEIWQEVSRIDQSTPGLSDVVTVKRQISTVVSAEEGETIAIGGLKIEQQELGISKVPILGDLPLIGGAFRQEFSNTISRNLAIFLRPTLVNDKEKRKSIVTTWEEVISDGVFDTGSKKSRFFNPAPVGNKSITTSLRPKMRPR